MSNSISAIGLNLLAQMGLDAMMDRLTAFEMFATKFTAANVAKGKIIDVRLFNPPAEDGSGTGDWNSSTNNYETATAVDWDKVQVTLNQHKKSTFALSDEEQGQIHDNALEKEVKLHAQTVAKLAMQEIFDLVVSANFATVALTGAASTFDTDDFADLYEAAQTAKMDMDTLSCMIKNTYATYLRKDDAIKHFLNSNSDQTLREGKIGRLSGFDVYESTILPTASSTAADENLTGFITDGKAIAVACGIISPGVGADQIIEHAVATDDKTGFSLGLRAHYAPATGTSYMTAEILMGVKTGRAASLQRIRSAAPST